MSARRKRATRRSRHSRSTASPIQPSPVTPQPVGWSRPDADPLRDLYAAIDDAPRQHNALLNEAGSRIFEPVRRAYEDREIRRWENEA